MSVAGSIALFGLPATGRDQRRGARDHGLDRPAVSGSAVLWLTADGSVAGNPRSSRQPQAGPAADAGDGAGGGLSATEHQQGGERAQGLRWTPNVGQPEPPSK